MVKDPHRSLVVVIFDLLCDVEDVLGALKHLRFVGHNAIVMHTLDPYEMKFPFDGTKRFEGLDGEDPLRTQPLRIRDESLKNFGEYTESLRSGCVAAQIDYAVGDTSRPLDVLLSEFFNERETTMGAGSPTARP